MEVKRVVAEAAKARDAGATRYCMGAAWRNPKSRDMDAVVAMVEGVKALGRWYHRYGRWSLLLSWVPVVGDPLTVAAGVLREPLWSFVVLVAVAKVARYLTVAAATLSWM